MIWEGQNPKRVSTTECPMILNQDNEYTALLDACVLVPMCLCDTLLRFAKDPAMFRPLWSTQILKEVGDALSGPTVVLSGDVTDEAFNEAVADATVAEYDSCSYPMFRRMRAGVKDQAESIAISMYNGPVDLTYGSDQDMERVNLQYVSGWKIGRAHV